MKQLDDALDALKALWAAYGRGEVSDVSLRSYDAELTAAVEVLFDTKGTALSPNELKQAVFNRLHPADKLH